LIREEDVAEYNGFEPVIGLEVHAQLLTETKVFCGCKSAYGASPNTYTCPICLGLPGSLPVLNKKAAEYAMKMILAVGGKVSNRSVFARKNYFYPDLPKGYQISQFDKPIGEGGSIPYRLDSGEEKLCRLIRIHLEEDAGKLLHPEAGENYSRVDLNRCGAPLIEIVTEADIRSPEEAYAYLVTLRQLVQYLEVCSGDMEKGHLRCDANVSVRPVGQKKFGTRTEVKNMNSFKGVERAITYEINRQIALIQSGGEVIQATLLWNEAKQAAEMMRTKEESHDYRYFPEPDLVNLVISDSWIHSVRDSLPELPKARATRFVTQYGIREYDAQVLTATRALAKYYEKVMESFGDGIAASNWIQTELLGVINQQKKDIATCTIEPEIIADLLTLVKSGKISGKIAKTVFKEMNISGKSPASIIQKKVLEQISDESLLEEVITEIFDKNQANVTSYRAGKTALFGFFVGQTMKATGGRANPNVVSTLLKKMLEG